MLFLYMTIEGGKRPEPVAQIPSIILELCVHTEIFHEHLFVRL